MFAKVRETMGCSNHRRNVRDGTSARGGNHTRYKNRYVMPGVYLHTVLAAPTTKLLPINDRQHHRATAFPNVPAHPAEVDVDGRINLTTYAAEVRHMMGCSHRRDIRYAGWQWNGDGRISAQGGRYTGYKSYRLTTDSTIGICSFFHSICERHTTQG